MTDYVSRNDAIEIGRRTLKNLKYIKASFEREEKDVHVVTHLVISLLGLVVLPREQYLEKSIWDAKLAELTNQGWPEWSIILDEDKRKTETLGELVRHIRNATAHGLITFSSDSRYLSEVVIKVADRESRNKAPYWRAEIGGKELYKFCLKFSEYIEGTIG